MSPDEEGGATAVSAQITLKTDRVLRVMRTAGFTSTAQQAAAIGVDTSTWYRVTTERSAPSPKVVAGILRRFPDWPFDELFSLPDDEPAKTAA